MPTSRTTAQTPRRMAPRCAAIPGWMRARHDLVRANAELMRVAKLALETNGVVPRTEKDHHPDAMANLWFIRAVHELSTALKGGHDHAAQTAAVKETQIPLCKKIVQQFISDKGIDGLRMDDGGLLVHGGSAGHGGHAAHGAHGGHGPGHAAHPTIAKAEQADAIRINALWYFALEMTAQALAHPHAGQPKDPSAHHFERLAGRFRRSFAKNFWCDEHGCLCSPAARTVADHGFLPDPDQLLITMFAVSPLPRTKQRQILSRITGHSMGNLGVKLHHPVYGEVESPLHRAWLAQGVALDDPAKAAALVAPLTPLWEAARKNGVHAFYRDGKAVPGGAHKPDPLASSEVLGVLEKFQGRRG